MRTEPISARAKNAAYTALFFVVATVSFSISLYEITSSIFVVLALTSFFTSKRRIAWKNPLILLTTFYLMVVAVSVTQSETVYNSVRGLTRVLRCLLLAFSVIYVVDDEKKLNRIFNCLLLTAFLIGVDAVIQGATGHELLRGRQTTPFRQDEPRWTGPFHHANDFAGYLSFALLPFMVTALLGRRFCTTRKYIFCLSGLALLTVCLVQTYSRGAWLAVAIGAFAFVVHQKNTRTACVVLITGLFMFMASPAVIQTRALSIVDMKSGTILERTKLWEEASRIVRARPILGHGINTYAAVEPRFHSGKFDKQYAHNGYLQMAAETGLVGLIVFFSFIVFFLTTAAKTFSGHPRSLTPVQGLSLIFGILSFLLHSATDTNLHSVLLVSLFWLAIGLAWAAVSLTSKQKSIFAE